MSTTTVELPDSLKQRIEELAVKEGYTISQFLVSAAGEKLAAMLTMDYLRREATAGRRGDFERYMAAVPDVAPPENDRLVANATTRKRGYSPKVATKKQSQGVMIKKSPPNIIPKQDRRKPRSRPSPK